MTGTQTALCAAITIDDAGEQAPEWLHLLPAGVVTTRDGRGPYRVADAPAMMAASLADGKLTLCENHATDLAAPKGDPAPAHGWITELQQRADGIWGRVDWVDAAARIWRRYRGISPVISHAKNGTVGAILRATLTNTPNLAGLTALHSKEDSMDLRLKLIELMKLDSSATDEDILAAFKKMMDDEATEPDAVATAMQSALAPIAALVGVAKGADAAAVLAGVQQMRDAKADDPIVTGLQSALRETATKLNTLVDATSRKDATTFVDGAIGAGRVGVKPMRDEYITMHMEDPARAEKLIGAMPIVKGGATLGGAPIVDAKDGLGDADTAVVALMGIDRAEYAKTLAAQKEVML